MLHVFQLASLYIQILSLIQRIWRSGNLPTWDDNGLWFESGRNLKQEFRTIVRLFIYIGLVARAGLFL